MQSTIVWHMSSASSPRNNRRRENFRLLVTEAGGLTATSSLIKSPTSHISAILAGNAGIGDKLAQKIERAFSLDEGSLDLEKLPNKGTDEVVLLGQTLERLLESGRMSREEVAGMLQMLLAREKLSQN
jgi:hypothetical protein